MFPDPGQAPVELQTISVTAEVLTALVQLRNNNQVNLSPVRPRVVVVYIPPYQKYSGNLH